MFGAFVTSLEANCGGQGIGFGYAVFDRDRVFKTGGDGLAVRAVKKDDIPSVKFTATTRLNVHSISKTICAAINYDGAVDNRSYTGMKIAVQRGVVQPPGMRDYQNVNFALGRVLLPYIDGSRDARELNMLPEPEFNTWTTTHFIDEVRRHLFRFKGAARIAPTPNGPRPFTRYYDADTNVCDIEPLPATNPEHVGASSWWISAVEYRPVPQPATLRVGLRAR